MTGAILIDLWVWEQQAELELLRVAYVVSVAPGIAASLLVLLASGALGYTLHRARQRAVQRDHDARIRAAWFLVLSGLSREEMIMTPQGKRFRRLSRMMPLALAIPLIAPRPVLGQVFLGLDSPNERASWTTGSAAFVFPYDAPLVPAGIDSSSPLPADPPPGGCHRGSCAWIGGGAAGYALAELQSFVLSSPTVQLPPVPAGRSLELRFWTRAEGLPAIGLSHGPFQVFDPTTWEPITRSVVDQIFATEPPLLDKTELPWTFARIDITAWAGRNETVVFTQLNPDTYVEVPSSVRSVFVVDDVEIGLATTTTTSTSTTTTTLEPPCASEHDPMDSVSGVLCTLEALDNTLNDPVPLSCRSSCSCKIAPLLTDIPGLLDAAAAASTPRVCRTEQRLAHRQALRLGHRIATALRRGCLAPTDRARRLVPWVHELMRRTAALVRTASCPAS